MIPDLIDPWAIIFGLVGSVLIVASNGKHFRWRRWTPNDVHGEIRDHQGERQYLGGRNQLLLRSGLACIFVGAYLQISLFLFPTP